MDNKLSNIKERILYFAKNEGIAYESFFEKIGMTYGSFKGEAKKRPLNSEALENILTIFPKVSAEWLITGQGEMLKESKEVIQVLHQPVYSEKKLEEQSVFLYDVSAAANLKTLFISRDQNILGKIMIPDMPKCDGAVYVKGDSMYPLLKSGDIIAYKELNSLKNIVYGEMYLLSFELDGDEFLTVKYINKSEHKDHILLISHNTHHQPMDIPIESVYAMALVKLSIRMNTMR